MARFELASARQQSDLAILSALYNMLYCKAMATATLSSKNQIVIPREAREALHLKAGDQILVVVRGSKVILLQKPKSHSSAIRGLAPDLYGKDYVEKERQSWG
jgi:AbrB family looped-hinge helix DNA binding protein